MNKNIRLEQLFVNWIKTFPKYDGKFYKDGIINEIMYEKQTPKLLFITKEPNDPEQNEGDFREWWSKVVSHSFSFRICEWSYGFFNNFPPLINFDNEDKIKIMSKIAFMNVKKSGGKGRVDQNIIKRTVQEEKSFIINEIDIISPNIIIGSLGAIDYWNDLFPDIKFFNSGYDIKIARIREYKIINFYHPSYRIPRAMSYSLLGNVFNSKVFNNI